MKPGSAPPRFRYIPPAATRAAADEAIQLGESVGITLDPWQQEELRGSLGEREDGRWAATEVGVIVPRQNGKNGILTVRETAGLVLFGERLQTHTAHRFDTALEHYIWMRELFTNWDGLRRRVKKIPEGNGAESIVLWTKKFGTQRLVFKARAKHQGRGFAGDLVVFDEAFWLLEVGALVPSLSARPNPQIWYTSSAPLPRAESNRLRRIIRRGRALARGELKAASFAYGEWSVEGKVDEVDLDDRHLWAVVNPSLGYVRANGSGLREDYIADVERGGLMDDEEFARERLGIFDDGDDAVSAIDGDDWAECHDERKPDEIDGAWMLDPVCLGVHVAKERRSATIAAAGDCSGGGLAVEIVDQRPGALWVPDRLVELVGAHRPRMVTLDRRFFDPLVLAKLEEAKLAIVDVKLEDHIRACSGLFDDIVAHHLRQRGQPVLDAAVAAAITRAVGDAWLWDTRIDDTATPLVAVTLARWGHVQPIEDDPDDDGEDFAIVV